MPTRVNADRRHYWIDAAGQDNRAAVITGLPVPPPLLPATSAHRRLRGPYTAAGTIIRALAADALERFPALVAAHEIELRCVTPELRDRIPATRETLTSLAVPAERTRFYSRLRTLRIAHGLTEFLRDYAAATGEPRSIVIDQLDDADQTDQELVSVLLRRLDPRLLTLVIGTSGTSGTPASGRAGAAAGRSADPLFAALARYAARPDVGCLNAGTPVSLPSALHGAAAVDLAQVTDSAEGVRRLAATYVCGDCLSDASELEAAYLRLAPAERSRLHDARAAELTATGEFSLRLGAVPFHRERGADPAGAGAEALREALDYCIDMGFYEATVDLGRRGRAVIDWQAQPDLWWTFTTKMTTSLAALGLAADAERLYDEARAFSDSAAVHMQAAYATAMLYTRHHDEEERDDDRALGWINEAIAIARLLPDVKVRAMQTVFNQNGLALIRSHQGDRDDALRLVGDGLARLDSELDPDEHRLHRSVLRYNRAQLYAGLGRLEEALADYTAVIEEDPHYAEYHFDRAALLRRLRRDDEAMSEYETAMRLSPPFPELYYNRGDLRSALGDDDGALADFGYVLEIDPGYVDAYINRVAILMEAGQRAAARRDLTAALAVAPDDPHLLCLLARLELEEGHRDDARAAADAAVRAGDGVAEAWATRAAIAFETGDPGTAVTDLTRAIDLAPDPAVLFNRALAHQALGNWAAAEADFTAVLEVEPAEDEARLRRAECRRRLGSADGASDGLRPADAMAPDRAAAGVMVAGGAR
jgi:tetratricopeptide (TPR) repeat protein